MLEAAAIRRMANVYRCVAGIIARSRKREDTRGTSRRGRGVGTMMEERMGWEGKKIRRRKRKKVRKKRLVKRRPLAARNVGGYNTLSARFSFIVVDPE